MILPTGLIQILSEYGMVAVFTIIFLIMFTRQNDKYFKFLTKLLEDSKQKDFMITEMKDKIEIFNVEIGLLSRKIDALKEIIIKYFGGKGE